MEKVQKRRPKVYGRAERLAEIFRILRRPELLDDITVDMIYCILAA